MDKNKDLEIAKQCVFCRASHNEAECTLFEQKCWKWLLGECPGYVVGNG